jgi:hypothetical protein
MIKKYLVDFHTGDEQGVKIGFDAMTIVTDEKVIARMKEVVKITPNVTQVVMDIDTFILYDFGVRVDKSTIDKISSCNLIVTEEETSVALILDSNYIDVFVEFDEDETPTPTERDIFPIVPLCTLSDPVMGLGREWNHGTL